MSSIVRALFVVLALPTLVSAQAAKGPLTAFDPPFTVPEMTEVPKDLKPFEYKDVGNQIPNYKANKGGQERLDAEHAAAADTGRGIDQAHGDSQGA